MEEIGSDTPFSFIKEESLERTLFFLNFIVTTLRRGDLVKKLLKD